ncbi:22087_t:CDS:2, partial [Cetraspora pellucida]
PKKRKLFCCSLEQSVFIGSENENSLIGVTGSDLRNSLLDVAHTTDFHILKISEKPFGHIHFKTEHDAGTFYRQVQHQPIPGPNKLILNFLPSKQKNSDEFTVYKVQNDQTNNQNNLRTSPNPSSQVSSDPSPQASSNSSPQASSNSSPQASFNSSSQANSDPSPQANSDPSLQATSDPSPQATSNQSPQANFASSQTTFISSPAASNSNNDEIYTLNLCINKSYCEDDIFVIDISKNKKVDSLKPIIKKRLAPLFDHIPSTKITLYKNGSEEKMNPTTIISEYFPSVPDSECIHIFVCHPY